MKILKVVFTLAAIAVLSYLGLLLYIAYSWDSV